jgi:hypothetical protein
MTQTIQCRTLIALRASLGIFVLCLALPVSSQACQLPTDYPQAYKDFYDFTKTLEIATIHGVDECLGRQQSPLLWTKECDDQGNFKSYKAEVFLLPKVTFTLNEKKEFKVENFYFSDWNYSKVDDSELAEVFIKRGRELKLIYTTQSARKVHLTFVKGDANRLKGLETLVYKMNIGTPSLESKFSCFDY